MRRDTDKKENVVIKFYFYLPDEKNNVKRVEYDSKWEIMLQNTPLFSIRITPSNGNKCK
jgi:hypothetical protein